MKIGIISTYAWLLKHDNYGTLLQNFALQKQLKKLGHNSYWIRNENKSQIKKSIIKELILTILIKIFPKKYKNHKELRQIESIRKNNPRHFKDFIKMHMEVSKKTYYSFNIKEIYPDADAYISGSDQIWYSINDLSFLNFATDKKVKRIAYAVSRPWTDTPESWLMTAKETINNFDAVSVREEEGVDICKKANYTTAKWVADPTLFLTKQEYMNVVSKENENKQIKKPFALIYCLNIEDKEEIFFSELEKSFKKKNLDINIVAIQKAESAGFPKAYIKAPTPTQWLNMYDKAECVFTNSFHGMMFSIIFRKNFIVLLQNGKTGKENVRFISLIKKLKLEDRILSYDMISKNPNIIKEKLDTKIDWENAEKILNLFILESKEFLENALK